MPRAQSLKKASTTKTATRVTGARAGCPPHYWIISQDSKGERWDCQSCAAIKRPVPPRFIAWGERACTWSREERYLAGLEQADQDADLYAPTH